MRDSSPRTRCPPRLKPRGHQRASAGVGSKPSAACLAAGQTRVERRDARPLRHRGAPQRRQLAVWAEATACGAAGRSARPSSRRSHLYPFQVCRGRWRRRCRHRRTRRPSRRPRRRCTRPSTRKERPPGPGGRAAVRGAGAERMAACRTMDEILCWLQAPVDESKCKRCHVSRRSGGWSRAGKHGRLAGSPHGPGRHGPTTRTRVPHLHRPA